jgi:hypothetical protein
VGTLTTTITVPSAPLTGTYTVIVSDSDINREGSAIGNYVLTATGVDPTVCDIGVTPGVTVIRAQDVGVLRDRVNGVRVGLGLLPFSFTDGNVIGVLVKANHFLELRSALQDAYVAAGRAVPVYTDPTLVPQVTVIKAVHILELCSAVAAIP